LSKKEIIKHVQSFYQVPKETSQAQAAPDCAPKKRFDPIDLGMSHWDHSCISHGKTSSFLENIGFSWFSIKGKAAKFANTSKESHETSKALSKLGITAILFQPSGSTNQMKRTRHSHTCQGHFTKRSVAAIGAAADIMTCVLYIQAK